MQQDLAGGERVPEDDAIVELDQASRKIDGGDWTVKDYSVAWAKAADTTDGTWMPNGGI